VNVAFTPEQDELRATVRRLLSRHHGPAGPLWTTMTKDLGLTALAVPEEHGGFGASLVEVAIAIEEAGAALAAVPLLATATATAAIDPDMQAAADLLPGLADGTTVAALAFGDPGDPCRAEPDADAVRLTGVAHHVLDGAAADVVVVAARLPGGDDALFAVSIADCARTAHPTLDQTRGQASLGFTGAPARRVSRPGDGGAAAARALGLLRAALAVESVGVARAALSTVVTHLTTRKQFGVPLATFQALRHRVADLHVGIEAATSSAWYAVRVAGAGEFPTAAAVAKLVATEAAYTVTAQAIQLLGGIGFTWEHDAHRYFKRATANRLLAGDPVMLRRALARSVWS
jgi:alkylation response protein AidB-like acyl-CoA dehydrogenase